MKLQLPLSPATGIPESKAKEFLSLAYFQAIVAQAGLAIKRYDWDDGFDLDVGRSLSQRESLKYRNLYFSIQLKCTAAIQLEPDATDFGFVVNARTYELLRDTRHPPVFLVVYLAPPNRSRWLTHQLDHTRFYNCCYYADLRGLEALRPRKNGAPRMHRTVYISLHDRLTAVSLLTLHDNAIAALQGHATHV
ncbi:MAG: DUF4365 domain-containing protein [Phycisphaerales bacterium]